MGFKKHIKCAVCLVLTVMMLCSVMLCVNAADGDVAQTGVGEVVYFRNTDNWSTVNAYMWKNGNGDNGGWPGKQMTKVEDNVYMYEVPGDYDMIIFNNGSTQTDDLSFAGDGKIFDYATKQWSDYEGHTPNPNPNPQPTTPQPTTPTPTQGGSTGTKYVYCKNSAGWSSVNCYMWKDGAGDNGGWPGVAMTNIGEDIWQYEITGDWNMIIFNGGGNQTGDMSFPGAGQIYDNSTKKWETYDVSPLAVKSFGADVLAPQYKGTDITLKAEATGVGNVFYKFSVTLNGVTTVVQDYSATATATWTPTAAGEYTITFDFKDTANNTNQRTMKYTVADDSNVAAPILKGVTLKPGQIKKGTAQTLSAKTAGGKTGTNLLFYKFVVTDPSGNKVNVPYYSKTNSLSFTPSVLGEYKVTVYVQASDNETVERTYTYTSVNDINVDPQPPVPTTPTPTEPTPKPTTSGDYLRGDANDDGDVNVLDATQIQRHAAKIAGVYINEKNADADLNNEVNVIDATMIQRFIAKLEKW